MNKCKKIISITALIILTLAMSTTVLAKSSGKCGKNAKYIYDKSAKVLTISGKGKIKHVSKWDSMDVKKVVIKNGITEIGKNAFFWMKIKRVSLPKTVKVIGEGAFGRTDLEKIKISKNIKIIGEKAFDMTKLKKVVVPSTVHTVGSGAFGNCNRLTTVIWEKNKLNNAFDWCKNLKTIKLKKDLKEIGDSALCHTGFEYFTEKNGKKSVLPKTVTKIGEGAFYKTKIKKIEIGSNITYVGSDAFRYCSRLTDVSWYYNNIPDRAFLGCKKLSKLEIKSKITSIGSMALKNTNIKKFDLKEGLLSIGNGAFKNTGITELSLPNSVKSICKKTFDGMNKLKKISISKNIDNISASTFEGCPNLETILVVEGNSKYSSNKDGMLCDLSNKTLVFVPRVKKGTITLPKEIETIGAAALHGCKAEKVIIPNTVKNIKICAFATCPNLKEITIPSSVKSIPEAAFVDCKKLEKVVVEQGVEKIWQQAFENCSELKTVVLPESLTYIHVAAFANTSPCIVGENNSLAIKYAKENGYKYSIQ